MITNPKNESHFCQIAPFVVDNKKKFLLTKYDSIKHRFCGDPRLQKHKTQSIKYTTTVVEHNYLLSPLESVHFHQEKRSQHYSFSFSGSTNNFVWGFYVSSYCTYFVYLISKIRPFKLFQNKSGPLDKSGLATSPASSQVRNKLSHILIFFWKSETASEINGSLMPKKILACSYSELLIR